MGRPPIYRGRSLGKQARGAGWEKGKKGLPNPHPRLVLLEIRSNYLPKGLGTS